VLAYLLRTLPAAVRARIRARRAPAPGTAVSRIYSRVWPRQVDLNLHMNQAAYAEVTELGRVDWLIATGAWDRWRQAGVKAVVAEQRIVYRRELRPGARFAVDTRATGIEGRLFALCSLVIVGDRVHARNDAKLIFIGPAGVLAPEQVAPLCVGLVAGPPPIDDWRLGGG
jgi:acyl-CoA thioesterase FadM